MDFSQGYLGEKMWEISNSEQVFSFFTALLFGVGYSVFYCILRAIRKSFRHNALAVFIEDILFFLITAITTFLLLLALTNGEIRFYMLLGIFLGFSLFYFTLCDFLSSIIAAFFKGVKWCVLWVAHLLGVIFNFFGKNLRNYYKYLKKPLKEKG